MMKDFMSIYKAFQALSEDMLASAKQGDWPVLVDMEKRRSSLISLLKKTGEPQKESIKTRDAAHLIIQKIMALDQETRHCIQHRMTSLKKKAHTERKLVETYGMASIS